MIKIVPYDPTWPEQFEREALHLREVLKDNCIAIHHVGSTAVPGLCAKPKLDILAIVNDLQTAISPLEEAGYPFKGELHIPFRYFFRKREGSLKVNLHVYEEGNPEIELHLLFRDYLRNHPEKRDEYAALKTSLLRQKEMHQKVGFRLSGYNLGKDAFIKEVLEKAGFSGLCMRQCIHHEERAAARRFSQTEPQFSDDHIHLIFYEGTHIIGYADIELSLEKSASFNAIAFDTPHLKHKDYFLNLCQQWLTEQGYTLFAS